MGRKDEKAEENKKRRVSLKTGEEEKWLMGDGGLKRRKI